MRRVAAADRLQRRWGAYYRAVLDTRPAIPDFAEWNPRQGHERAFNAALDEQEAATEALKAAQPDTFEHAVAAIRLERADAVAEDWLLARWGGLTRKPGEGDAEGRDRARVARAVAVMLSDRDIWNGPRTAARVAAEAADAQCVEADRYCSIEKRIEVAVAAAQAALPKFKPSKSSKPRPRHAATGAMIRVHYGKKQA
jgi:hypothetical protein